MAEHLLSLYAYDGARSGCRKCSSVSKALVAYRIPRSRMDAMADNDDLKRNGIYFLFGENEKGKKFVYIGKVENRINGDGMKSRLQEHLKDKDYWYEVVILTTCNRLIQATEASYLERKFYDLAKEAQKYTLNNKNRPSFGRLDSSLSSELNKIVRDGKLYMSALGYDFLVPPQGKTPQLPDDVFIGKTKRCYALLVQSESGVSLLKGGKISKTETKTCTPNVKYLRRVFKDAIGKNWILKKDLPFASPSSAAGFETGSTVSGLTFFRNTRGVSLADYELE